MHAALLVTYSRKHANTSAQAREYVYKKLLSDPSFVAEGGIGAVADWFVIGGRDSGFLTEVTQRLSPLDRDPYQRLGYEDDAMVVNQQLYTSLLQEFEGQSRGYVGVYKDLVFMDLDEQTLAEATFIGKKWLVVVDYHS